MPLIVCDTCGREAYTTVDGRGNIRHHCTEHGIIDEMPPTPPLLWTKELPTELGFHWFRNARTNVHATIVRIVDMQPAGCIHRIRTVIDEYYGHHALKDWVKNGGEWAGPIPEPR